MSLTAQQLIAKADELAEQEFKRQSEASVTKEIKVGIQSFAEAKASLSKEEIEEASDSVKWLQDVVDNKMSVKTIGETDTAISSGSGQIAVAVAGQTVPERFWNPIIRKAFDGSLLLRFCQILPMDTDVTKIPAEGTAVSGAWYGEGKTIAESNPTFGTVALTAYRYSIIVSLTRELLADSKITPSIVAVIQSQIANDLAKAIDKAILNGGSGEPSGIFRASGIPQIYVGEKTKANQIVLDSLIDAYYKLPMSYRNRAIIVGTTSVANSLRKAKTGDVYAWTNQFTQGGGALAPAVQPMVLNRPFVEIPDSYVPDNLSPTGATAKNGSFLVIGDFSGYLIGERSGMEVETSAIADNAFKNHLLKIKASRRIAGNVGLTEKFVLAGYDAKA